MLNLTCFVCGTHPSTLEWQESGEGTWFRAVLVFKAHRLVYHSTLGERVIQERNQNYSGDNIRANSQKWTRPGIPPDSDGILMGGPLLGGAICPDVVSRVAWRARRCAGVVLAPPKV